MSILKNLFGKKSTENSEEKPKSCCNSGLDEAIKKAKEEQKKKDGNCSCGGNC
ncbi:MAG: hypothetical protein ACRC6A_12920 [Fusobacteriaceae bacterium]